MRIGIDVGSTNTDAVLIDGEQILAGVKSPTLDSISDGVIGAVRSLQEAHPFDPVDVQGVMVGTTHFINALIEAKKLTPTASIRLGLPATSGLPPFVGWPERIRNAVRGQGFMIHGGHEFDGRIISPLDAAELRCAVDQALENGAQSLSIVSVSSPMTPEFELQAQEIISAEHPHLALSLSHEIGRVGLLERENATIINAALRGLSEEICGSLAQTLKNLGIDAPLYLSQNDGTLMDVEQARKYPVATFSSGPTNSMRGASFLASLENCIVVDVGGTTSDVGVLANGFPRQAGTEIEIAGIRTNFRMPDVYSIGVGGGSIVGEEATNHQVGPDSVGYRLLTQARIFGGPVLTASDVMVASGRTDFGDRALVGGVPESIINAGLPSIASQISDSVDRMRTSPEPGPVVAVGGGTFMVPKTMEGASEVVHPEHAGVANAIGAAIAQVGGEIDRIVPVPAGQRDTVLDKAKEEAVERAVAAGADPSTASIVDIDEPPLAHLPGYASRIRIKAVGDLPLPTTEKVK